jgi:hypothetical protein
MEEAEALSSGDEYEFEEMVELPLDYPAESQSLI